CSCRPERWWRHTGPGRPWAQGSGKISWVDGDGWSDKENTMPRPGAWNFSIVGAGCVKDAQLACKLPPNASIEDPADHRCVRAGAADDPVPDGPRRLYGGAHRGHAGARLGHLPAHRVVARHA